MMITHILLFAVFNPLAMSSARRQRHGRLRVARQKHIVVVVDVNTKCSVVQTNRCAQRFDFANGFAISERETSAHAAQMCLSFSFLCQSTEERWNLGNKRKWMMCLCQHFYYYLSICASQLSAHNIWIFTLRRRRHCRHSRTTSLPSYLFEFIPHMSSPQLARSESTPNVRVHVVILHPTQTQTPDDIFWLHYCASPVRTCSACSKTLRNVFVCQMCGSGERMLARISVHLILRKCNSRPFKQWYSFLFAQNCCRAAIVSCACMRL